MWQQHHPQKTILEQCFGGGATSTDFQHLSALHLQQRPCFHKLHCALQDLSLGDSVTTAGKRAKPQPPKKLHFTNQRTSLVLCFQAQSDSCYHPQTSHRPVFSYLWHTGHTLHEDPDKHFLFLSSSETSWDQKEEGAEKAERYGACRHLSCLSVLTSPTDFTNNLCLWLQPAQCWFSSLSSAIKNLCSRSQMLTEPVPAFSSEARSQDVVLTL